MENKIREIVRKYIDKAFAKKPEKKTKPSFKDEEIALGGNVYRMDNGMDGYPMNR